MSTIFWLLLFIGGGLTLAYRAVDLKTSTIAAGAALVAYLLFGNGGVFVNLLLILGLAGMVALNLTDFRRERISRPILSVFRKILPTMSDTEREALAAGTVWWDGELFSGTPDFNRLLSTPRPTLSAEEQAFLDGPVDELCAMIDDWKATHEEAELSEETWEYLKAKGFFAMIIPKKYGGLEFSALAHSAVLAKVAGRSAMASSVIAVPNSLGPAELIHEYGTQEQKDYYLPRLAKGEEIPCFGLTSPKAGSDATSLEDTGIVCHGTFDGKEVLGLRLNWNKRYITLAPVSTVLGLAFKMYDPDGLLGDVEDYGITCALIPTDLPGVTIGRRHFPLNIPFPNGPTQGKDVFVPLDFIIGGVEMAGKGWRMLVESLTVGRCISLPSNASGGARAGLAATGAYARVRKQFGMPIGRFEGVAEALARVAGRTYIAEATRTMTAGAVDQGHRPAVPSAIVKYHLTEIGRQVADDVMDVLGGKGIMLGPKNIAGRGYQVVPVTITVEGANILTRSMIIYGQGAIRCHPYVLTEMQAAQNEDRESGLDAFDDALFSHIGLVVGNAARAFVTGLTLSRFVSVPVDGPTKRYYQHISRFSSAFGLLSDVAMLTMGGALKKREMISGRLGDVLSYMYMASAVLKRFEDQGRPSADLPVVEWACRDLLYRAQEQLHGVLRNFPNRWVAAALRFLMFPRGRTYYAPHDRLEMRVTELFINPTETRARLIEQTFMSPAGDNQVAALDAAMRMAVELRPLEKRIRKAVKDGQIPDRSTLEQIDAAVGIGIITAEEADSLRELERVTLEVCAVDDFAHEELGTKPRGGKRSSAKRSAAPQVPPAVEATPADETSDSAVTARTGT